jgi:hypothetical protein
MRGRCVVWGDRVFAPDRTCRASPHDWRGLPAVLSTATTLAPTANWPRCWALWRPDKWNVFRCLLWARSDLLTCRRVLTSKAAAHSRWLSFRAHRRELVFAKNGRRLRGLGRRPRRTGDRVTRRAQCVVLIGLGGGPRVSRAGAGPRRGAFWRRGFAWVPGAARAGNASRENGPSLPIRPWPVDALVIRSTRTPAPPQGPYGGMRDWSSGIVAWWNIVGRLSNERKGQRTPSVAAAGAARCSVRRNRRDDGSVATSHRGRGSARVGSRPVLTDSGITPDEAPTPLNEDTAFKLQHAELCVG